MTIAPQTGKQSEFVESEADIAFYGGQAGSGKSIGLLLIPLMFYDDPTFNGVIFRKTYPEITNPGGLWEEMEKFYAIVGAQSNQSEHKWTFPSGMYVQAAHLQHEKDKHRYQGSQIVYIGFDELTHFSKTQFFYIVSRNRKANSRTVPFVRATMNADADSWVAKFIDWWIDDSGFAIPERCGKIRWFITKNDAEIWADTREELVAQFPDSAPLSFTFINATLEDNQIFLAAEGESYKAKLQSLDDVQKQRLLYGNWKIKAQGQRLFRLPSFAPWQDINAVSWIDPAFSGDNHTAQAIVGWHNGRILARGFTWDKHVGDVYTKIVGNCERYKVGSLIVEDNADKGASARDILKLRGHSVRGHTERMNKHVRIVQYVYNNWHLIDFANDCEQDFMNCLLNYSEGVEPDDEADALAGAIRLLTSQRTGGKYRLRVATI